MVKLKENETNLKFHAKVQKLMIQTSFHKSSRINIYMIVQNIFISEKGYNEYQASAFHSDSAD